MLDKLVWLTNRPKERDQIRIFCLPYAGGGASTYREWSNYFPDSVGVYPVQLPGRENRVAESPVTNMKELINGIIEELKMFLDKKFIIFGHSMGAKIAYQLVKEIENTTKKHPKHLIISGNGAPDIPETNPIHNLSDKEFINALCEFNGMPNEILTNKEVMRFYLPLLRADFELSELYKADFTEPFDCPITVYIGVDDITIKKNDIANWRKYTLKEFEIYEFDGSHFFINESRRDVLRNMNTIINRYI